ncbi:hypothetical protein AVEN_85796-1 [Araneus ventricosus]|uniref:Uncharacterized protein n=1 Tax=Araneus ventricosus TaxID=182803 RepID=A0A4Y2JJW8_ARAVE|nr:hypothetical protein AVEN_85796-1 [Araneus ventricosus]
MVCGVYETLNDILYCVRNVCSTDHRLGDICQLHEIAPVRPLEYLSWRIMNRTTTISIGDYYEKVITVTEITPDGEMQQRQKSRRTNGQIETVESSGGFVEVRFLIIIEQTETVIRN